MAVAPLPPVRTSDASAESALLRCAAARAAGDAAPCGESGYRDRWLRRLPVRAVEIAEASGPVLRLPAGAAPGTLLVAREPGGRFGWISAVGLGPEGPALLRQGGATWVAGFTVEQEEER